MLANSMNHAGSARKKYEWTFFIVDETVYDTNMLLEIIDIDPIPSKSYCCREIVDNRNIWIQILDDKNISLQIVDNSNFDFEVFNNSNFP